MANPFVHVELLTDDLAQSKKFYNNLFDWKLEDVPGMDYTMVGVGEGTGGGMMKNPVPGLPSHWMAYVLVEDVNASTKKAMSLGQGRQRSDRGAWLWLVQCDYRSNRCCPGALAD